MKYLFLEKILHYITATWVCGDYLMCSMFSSWLTVILSGEPLSPDESGRELRFLDWQDSSVMRKSPGVTWVCSGRWMLVQETSSADAIPGTQDSADGCQNSTCDSSRVGLPSLAGTLPRLVKKGWSGRLFRKQSLHWRNLGRPGFTVCQFDMTVKTCAGSLVSLVVGRTAPSLRL